MAIQPRKSYKFALRSSLLITIALSGLLVISMAVMEQYNWPFLLLYAPICFVISFLIIQTRVERFIYRRIKKIYDDVSLLESSTFSSKPVTTDMKTLTQEIEKFAEDKKIEIDTLKIREEYRKDFLGNVSHELITKLEVGGLKLERETFDIIELVQNVFDLLEMKAAEKEISLTFDMEYNTPIWVNADREKIQQVVSNLLVNSIKYGYPKGTTEVSVENLIKNKVIIRVTDNGEGIPKKHIPRLFERFYRVDQSGSRKEGGSGLGLSIVKHIIEAHDEKIYVESEAEVGSEFSFTLEKTANNAS